MESDNRSTLVGEEEVGRIMDRIRAKLAMNHGGTTVPPNSADPDTSLQNIRRKIADRPPSNFAKTDAGAKQPAPIHREIAAALTAHSQVGQLDPPLPGLQHGTVYFLRKLMRRSLAWYTRPIHLFQGAVIRNMQAVAKELQAIRSELQRLDEAQRHTAARLSARENGQTNEYWDPNFASPAWNHHLPETATLADILYCFRLLLGRNPKQQEWAGHSLRVTSDLRSLVSSYLNSEEFAGRQLLHQNLEQWELVDLPGFKMYASQDDKLIGAPIIQTKVHEPDVSQVVRQYLQPGMVVLDIGANIGYFTLLAASLVGPAGHVYGWEPSPENVRALYASQLVNKFSHLTIIQAAASDTTGPLQYFRNFSSGNVAGTESATPQNMLTSEPVMGLRIDDLISPQLKIDFVKIDAEGYEFKAMSGASQMLQQSRPVVVSEFCPANLKKVSGIDGQGYLELFAQLGYDISVITDQGPVAANIAQVLSRFEKNESDHVDLLLQPRARNVLAT